MALAIFAREAGMPSRIVEATIEVNQEQRLRMMAKIQALVPRLRGSTIAVLGLSFKPMTDDIRDSVGIDLVRMLRARGAKVRTFDPVAMERAAQELPKTIYFAKDSYDAVKGADGLVIATEWNEFRMLDLGKIRRLLRRPVVIDTRNIYEPAVLTAEGFRHEGVGRGRRVPVRAGDRKRSAVRPAGKATGRKPPKAAARPRRSRTGS
jgi:UDPglucose 6-dehydrogenase